MRKPAPVPAPKRDVPRKVASNVQSAPAVDKQAVADKAVAVVKAKAVPGNQTLLDAFQAVEVSLKSTELETQTAAVTLSAEAIENLLRSQAAQGLDAPSKLLLAKASGDAGSSVVISEHKEAAPPPP